MRKAFVDAIYKLAEKDQRVVFLTGDLGFQMFDDFCSRFPLRYLNVGIAEAQMVCAAAGLALEGMRPFIYSIASFATGRPYEFIKISVAYPGLPVIIVGAGGGYCYSSSGCTHHAPEDLALMSLLPGMTVIAPGDPGEVRELLPQMLNLSGPSYIRIGKFGEPEYQSPSPIAIGKARCLREGEQLAIVTTGEMASIALRAVEILNKSGAFPMLYQFHTVKPLDTITLANIVHAVRAIVVVEESAPIGGLAASLTQWVHAQNYHPLQIIRLGPPDAWALGNCSRETLRHSYGYDQTAIVQKCLSIWKGNNINNRGN